MRKITLTLIGLILSTLCIYSQEKPEFGKVKYYDLIRTYDKIDKDASACVVYEQGRYFFLKEEDGNMVGNRFYRDVYIRIHILDQAGIEYANMEIPYYSSSDDVDELTIEGYVYNKGENNTVIRTLLSDKNILTEKVSDKWYLKKIFMPDVREGSIIELHYKQGTYNYTMPVWNFQKPIPVLYSELRYEQSPYNRYAMIFKGADKYDTYYVDDEHTTTGAGYKSAQTNYTYTFGMRNLSAFEEVDFLRNGIDYRVAIYPQLASFVSLTSGTATTLISSWPILRKDLMSDSDFGRYIRSSAKEARKILPDLNLQGSGDADKIEAIISYVKNSYTWNRVGGKYASKKLSSFLKEKTGNAGNLNLFLAGMLQAAGIEAYPVILSTKSNGTINKEYPFRDLFNFVVVQAKADGKTYFLDCTETYHPFDMVSLDCIGAEGLVLKPDSEEWVVITNPHPAVNFSTMSLAIDPREGVLSGEVTDSYSGLAAVSVRRRYGGDRVKLEDMYKSSDRTLKDISAENYNDPSKPFLVKYGFEADLPGGMPDKILFSPLSFVAPSDNIFKETKPRRYPVDMVSKEMYGYSVTIAIPEGYEVEYLPEFINVNNNDVSMIYSASVSEEASEAGTNEGDANGKETDNGTGNETDNGTITINAQFSFKSAQYPAASYARLRRYYGEMIAAFAENVIILKKKE